jgi:hypothetical protein
MVLISASMAVESSGIAPKVTAGGRSGTSDEQGRGNCFEY